MEHRVAEQMHAVERYLLDEFTLEERADFEAHLFDCPICGEQVRQGAIAMENVKQVFREESDAREARQGTRNRGWADWFRVPVLIPTFAALALAAIVAYQRAEVTALERPQLLSSYALAPLARESAPVVPIDMRRPTFNLNFTVDAPRVYNSYRCEFQRADGAPVLKLNCGTQQVASFNLGVLLPTRAFPPGQYVMILRPTSEPQTEVQRYSFVIQDGGHTT
jgi:hypothetical protein